MLQYHMIADGRVQGVGFRYFVQMEADRHKIAGWVKNRDDGRVEILAEGPEESLKQFAEAVRKGGPFSNVTNVTIEESHRLKGYRTFSISY
ncbi:acylphosphatase [Bacillus velezensis]